jgi:hypothetical protein
MASLLLPRPSRFILPSLYNIFEQNSLTGEQFDYLLYKDESTREELNYYN